MSEKGKICGDVRHLGGASAPTSIIHRPRPY